MSTINNTSQRTTNLKPNRWLFALTILAHSLVPCGYSQSLLTNGLAAYYPFRGNANDESGHTNDGIVFGAALATDRSGASSNCYFFDGGSWIVVPNSTNLFFSTETIAIWLKASSFNSVALRAGNSLEDGWRGYALGPLNQGEFGYVDYGQGGYAAILALPVSQLPVDCWFQLALVRTANTASLYKNGELVAETTNLVPNDLPRFAPLHIGSNESGSNPYGLPFDLFHGYLDDLRIYNRALSASEVKALYEVEGPPKVHLIKAVIPSFTNLSLNLRYQLQVSNNLTNWTNYEGPFTVTNSTMVYPHYWDVENWSGLFFRLENAP